MQAFQKLTKQQTVPVIVINGVIESQLAAKVTSGLKRINVGTAKAVALVINSPGGSAVQSDMIAGQVQRFCKTNKLPLYTFAEDMAASGGYMLLSIGDKVYVDETSLVGSVGVISSWMGVKNFLDKHKVEQREFATQENLLERVFSPYATKPSAEQTKYVQNLLKGTHSQFINHVEEHRGDQITLSQEERQKQIYNADVFTGKKAVELGLADQIGNYQSVLFNMFPNASLDFVIKKTLREKMNEKGVNFNIQLPGFEKMSEKAVSQNLTAEFLKSFKN